MLVKVVNLVLLENTKGRIGGCIHEYFHGKYARAGADGQAGFVLCVAATRRRMLFTI